MANPGNRPAKARRAHSSARSISAKKTRPVKLSARANVPDAAMTRLLDALRRTLGEFIHPDTDRIGHAFPVDGSDYGRATFRPDGLRDEESQSQLRQFALALVRATAVIGVKEAAGLLVGWKSGEPVELRMCAVLSGLPLAAPVTPRQDIRIVPLALSTAELPRLPTRRDAAPRDYLGLSLLTVPLSASRHCSAPIRTRKKDVSAPVPSTASTSISSARPCHCKPTTMSRRDSSGTNTPTLPLSASRQKKRGARSATIS